MKHRNYVAKYAQRSGAGKHKRRDIKVSEYYRDTWNDADQQVITSEDHYSELQYLEDKVRDLDAQVQEMAQDEVYILSKIMFVRDHYSDDQELHGLLTSIVDLHSKDVKHKAVERLLKMYPNRHWGAF